MGTPWWWHQGSSPAGQNLVLASSARWPTSGAPCTSPGAPRAVRLVTPSCHLLQRERPHPPRSLPGICTAHNTARHVSWPCGAAGLLTEPTKPPTPAVTTAGIRPTCSCCEGQFYGKGLYLHTSAVPFSAQAGAHKRTPCVLGSVRIRLLLPPVSPNTKGTEPVTTRS